MKYDRFEQLPVWQAAMELAHRVYAVTEHRAFSMDGDLRSQIRCAALSVSNNIAEGFERGTTAELLSFLYIARCSAGEVRSMLHFCERYDRIAQPKPKISDLKSPTSNLESQSSDLKSQTTDLKSQISDLISLAESCSRQIRGWADSLQNSDIAGQRRLNDKARTAYDSKRRAEAFLMQVDEAVRRQHPPQTLE